MPDNGEEDTDITTSQEDLIRKMLKILSKNTVLNGIPLFYFAEKFSSLVYSCNSHVKECKSRKYGLINGIDHLKMDSILKNRSTIKFVNAAEKYLEICKECPYKNKSL